MVPNEHNKQSDGQLDAQFDVMLRQFVGRGHAVGTAACAGFDADTAAAYLEQALMPSARVRYDEHLAACAPCRRSLIELSHLMPQPAAQSTVTTPFPAASLKDRLASFPRWFDFSSWRWGTLAGVGAAGLAALLAVVTLTPLQFSRKATEVAQHAPSVRSGDSAAPSQSGAVETAQPRPEASQLLGSSEVNASRQIKLEMRQGEPTPPAAPNAAAGQTAAPPAPALANLGQLEAAKATKVSGKVSDTTGAAVVGAQVKLIDPASQQARSTTTNSAGEFNFSNVSPGRYLVEAQAPGFVRQQNVADAQAANEVVALELKPGAVAETVQVTSESQLLKDRKTEVATISEPDLAQRRRDSDLLLLSPGAASSERKLEAQKEGPKKAAQEEPKAQPTRGSRSAEKEAVADEARSEQKSSKSSARAANARAMNTEMRESAIGKPAAPPAPPSRRVGEKTFRLENGVWVDNQYKPADNLPVTRLTSGGEEFNRVVAERPALKPFFDLKPVIVVWQGRVYQVEGRK